MNPRLLLSTIVLLAALPLASAQPEPAASAPAASAAASGPHSRAAHVETMRRTHLVRLQEHLEKPEEELHRTCRFESDIATLPPEGVVALTFEAGPEPGHTEAILAVLARHKVPATFFLIAEKARAHPELVAQARALPGAVIGNHSWSHPNFHDIPVAEQAKEVDTADALLHADLGATPLFRYPYGNASCETNERVHTMGYRIVGWHVDSCDWAFDGPKGLSASEALSCGVLPVYRHDFLGHIVASVRAHRGGVVLMHETHDISVDNLDALITRLEAEGYKFSTPSAPEFQASLR
ncbi:MAG: polysaccharide deacetylase family protein [Caulobacter sp.]|nr:polysaccharide deacetylase family protein [Vitreoscilla sp.]